MPKIVVTPESHPLVISIINAWEGKLTWDLLCEKVSLALNVKDGVQRQSLSSYKEIQTAYSQKKTALREAKSSLTVVSDDVDAEYLRHKIAILNAELSRVNKINEAYKQRFVLWQYNAYKLGIRIDSLDDAIDKLEKPLTELKRKTGGN
ncbi:hypothetical protein [Photobacterium phosphoreum]|uniref:hypothetical protein n=1 Tax=Photobacterium phosphoreum TaxID=659 RepID=UPI001E3A79AD|nr:hypothetical protein [Photobacterium phosphoreum]MCD9475771.1 hypothetical protein [Photobacterium phosphoreum]MCF2176420.1 hypothetical protein [Photobacterium phosphoreum]